MRHTSVRRTLALTLLLAGALACNEREREPEDSAEPGDPARAREGDTATTGTAGGEALPTCAAPSGPYQPKFERRDGSCGSFVSAGQLVLDNNITIQKFPEQDVETETILANCTLQLNQKVVERATGFVRLLMRGPALELTTDGTIATGVISVQRFDERGAESCSGDYDATLTKAGKAIGAAATP